MPGEARCRCCGVDVGDGPRRALHRCILCDWCDGRHGDELQLYVAARARARAGTTTAWAAIGRMLVDDAAMAGMLNFKVLDGDTVRPWIPAPVPRWRVLIGRALARDEVPDLSMLVQVALAPYIPGTATRETLAALSRDLSAAFALFDPNVIDVEVDSARDVLDPHHLIISVKARTATAPGMVTVAAPDVEIPADIMTRPRGSA